MPSHSAKSLFALNIQSARECLYLYDTIVKLQPGSVNVEWLLRASVVFAVSALDTFFHDKVKYRVGRFSLHNLPPALARFEIPVSNLTEWESAQRKGNPLRNWVVKYLGTKPLQSPSAIADALRLAGIDALWDTIEPDKEKVKTLKQGLNDLIKRRNQISHEGDRLTSRKSGKKLRPIKRDAVKVWIEFAEDLVAKVEAAFSS